MCKCLAQGHPNGKLCASTPLLYIETKKASMTTDLDRIRPKLQGMAQCIQRTLSASTTLVGHNRSILKQCLRTLSRPQDTTQSLFPNCFVPNTRISVYLSPAPDTPQTHAPPARNLPMPPPPPQSKPTQVTGWAKHFATRDKMYHFLTFSNVTRCCMVNGHYEMKQGQQEYYCNLEHAPFSNKGTA